MDKPKVFVVILNWNLKDDTIVCVSSVLASSCKRLRVVVVDNGSQDGSALALVDRFGEAIDLIVNEENLGFAKGINVGIQHALAQGADWVLLLNNDTIIAPDMIERLMNMAGRRPDAGILAPVIFYYDQPERVWRIGDRHHRWLPIPLKVPARELKTRETLPAARMWHKVSRSTRGDVSRQRYLKHGHRVQFYRHRYSSLAWLYLIPNTLWVMLGDFARGNGQAAWACARGFYHGWRSSVANEPT
jgi:GT2 family glycosyltransferase